MNFPPSTLVSRVWIGRAYLSAITSQLNNDALPCSNDSSLSNHENHSMNSKTSEMKIRNAFCWLFYQVFLNPQLVHRPGHYNADQAKLRCLLHVTRFEIGKLAMTFIPSLSFSWDWATIRSERVLDFLAKNITYLSWDRIYISISQSQRYSYNNWQILSCTK